MGIHKSGRRACARRIEGFSNVSTFGGARISRASLPANASLVRPRDPAVPDYMRRSMNRLAIFASLLLAGYPARAGMCPHGNELGDGCPQANQNAVFKTPSFFTCTATWYCALAPGQTPYTALPTWNVASVDYPVGYDKTLTLKDPTTSALPPGCSYNGSITAPQVNCAGTTGLVLEGYDFGNTTWGGRTTGNGCVDLVVHGNVSGAIVIKNNRWRNGPDKVHGTFGCGIENSIMVDIYKNSVADSLTITNNLCGINAENGPAPNPNGVITCFCRQHDETGGDN